MRQRRVELPLRPDRAPSASPPRPRPAEHDLLALQRAVGNRAVTSGLAGGTTTIRRQAQPQPPSPETAADPIDRALFPGYGWWALNWDYDSMPTVDDAVGELSSWRPDLAGALAASRAERYGNYYAFRTTAGTVAARVLLMVSGTSMIGPRETTTYGIYVFVPDSVGETLIGWRSRAGGGRAGAAQAGTTAPYEPLLDLYRRRFPDSGGGTPTTSLTREMRIRLALELADTSVLGEIAETAKDAIRDPSFIATTILLIVVYVGLWLTPDPTFITKLAAAALTAVLLTMFAWQDLVGFARAWLQLGDDAAAATSEAQFRAAGDRFIRVGGRVAFDILLMIAFWGAGRAARPGLRAARARLATEARVRAETRVAGAREAPGGGAQQRATGAETTRVGDAEAAATPGATPTQILDQLAANLPEAARRGLATERAARAGRGGAANGDAALLDLLRGRQRGGMDVTRWLAERGLSAAERAQAQQAVADAQAALLRARLIEADAIRGTEATRRAVQAEFRRTLLDFARALLRLDANLRELVRARDVRALVGDLGEALGRALLRTSPEAATLRNPEVVSNLELARRLGGGTVADWLARERAAGRPVDLGRLRQGPDGVYESLGQIDNMLAERGADGRLSPAVLEEVKTGEADQPRVAQEQVDRARQTLADIGAGTSDARVMTRPTPNSVGADVTPRFDLRRPAATARTRGLAGRGFTETLGVDRPSLEAVARQLVTEGLPAGEPPTVVTTPTRDREPEPVP